MKKLLFILIFLLVLVTPLWATVKYLIPDGNGTYTQWTGVYTAVDDTVNGTCVDDYCYANANNYRETYTMRNCDNTSWGDSIPDAATTYTDSLKQTKSIVDIGARTFLVRDSVYATYSGDRPKPDSFVLWTNRLTKSFNVGFGAIRQDVSTGVNVDTLLASNLVVGVKYYFSIIAYDSTGRDTTVWDSTTTSSMTPFNVYLPKHTYTEGSFLHYFYNAIPATTNDTIQTDDTSKYGDRNVHLDIYYNSAGWNGYKYWMAYTPYTPIYGGLYEDPFVVVSNDGNGWIKACAGNLCNRIDAAGSQEDYNSDVDLIMGSNDSLYVIWRRICQAVCDPDSVFIKVSASGNGTSWTTPTISYRIPWVTTGNCKDALSPALVLNGSTYRMYYVNGGCDESLRIEYIEASSPRGTWGSPHRCYIKQGGLGSGLGHPWHLNVTARPDLNTYHFIILSYNDATPNYSLYFGESNSAGDTINLGKNRPFLPQSSSNPDAFDWTWNYRSAIVRTDSSFTYRYRLFYVGYNALTERYKMGHTTLCVYPPLIGRIYQDKKLNIFGAP